MPDTPATRRAVMIHGDGSISVDSDSLPEMGPKEVLMKTAASLISAGTETGGIKRLRANPREAEPRKTGYSTAGTVVAIGDEVTEFAVGDRIIGMAGECYHHADYNVGHPQVATHIPEGMSFDDAVMVCLAATSLQAVRRVDPKLGEFIAVVGQGLVGQFADQLFALAGARVAGIDLDDRRLEIAAAHGAEITINPEKQDMTETLIEWADGVGIDGSLMAYGGDGSKVILALSAATLKAPDTHQVGHRNRRRRQSGDELPDRVRELGHPALVAHRPRLPRPGLPHGPRLPARVCALDHPPQHGRTAAAHRRGALRGQRPHHPPLRLRGCGGGIQHDYLRRGTHAGR